jgi:cytoskeletal protein RodZ
MTIEGLGKKFQEARLAKRLTLEEAARMTKIRPTRLAEIESDDFSQFPSLAYAKGFLLIYGKFLDVDVTPYLEAFESSSNITIDGYSYLQEGPAPLPARTPIVHAPRRQMSQMSLWPIAVAVGVFVLGFLAIKFIVNLNRLAPRTATMIGVPEEAIPPAATSPTSSATAQPTLQATAVAKASAPSKTAEPEVRKAQAVRADDLANEPASDNPPPQAEAAETRVDIKPLKKTYIRVRVDNAAKMPEYERWISPSDGIVQFRGQHIAVRVLDREAIQVRKNGKPLSEGDSEVTIQ